MQTYMMSDPYIAEKLAELSAIPSKMILAWAYEEGGETHTGLLFVPSDAEARPYVGADDDAAKEINLALLELPRAYRRRIWQMQAVGCHGSDHDDRDRLHSR